MELVADVLFWCFSAIGMVGYRRRGERQMLVPAIVGAVAPLANLRHLPAVRIEFGAIELALLLLTLALLVVVQGLPGPLARRLRFGLRSRQWEFDRRFHIHREQMDRLLDLYPSSPGWPAYRSWRERVLGRGSRLVSKMRSMSPPNDEWRLVRDDYAALYDHIIDLVSRDQPPDDSYTLSRGTELKLRADTLRLKYRAEARAILGK